MARSRRYPGQSPMQHGGPRAGAGRPSLKDEDYEVPDPVDPDEDPDLDLMPAKVVTLKANEFRVEKGNNAHFDAAEQLLRACKVFGVQAEVRVVDRHGNQRVRHAHRRVDRSLFLEELYRFGQSGATVAQLSEKLYMPSRMEPEDWAPFDRHKAELKTAVWVSRMKGSIHKGRCPNTGRVLVKSLEHT